MADGPGLYRGGIGHHRRPGNARPLELERIGKISAPVTAPALAPIELEAQTHQQLTITQTAGPSIGDDGSGLPNGQADKSQFDDNGGKDNAETATVERRERGIFGDRGHLLRDCPGGSNLDAESAVTVGVKPNETGTEAGSVVYSSNLDAYDGDRDSRIEPVRSGEPGRIEGSGGETEGVGSGGSVVTPLTSNVLPFENRATSVNPLDSTVATRGAASSPRVAKSKSAIGGKWRVDYVRASENTYAFRLRWVVGNHRGTPVYVSRVQVSTFNLIRKGNYERFKDGLIASYSEGAVSTGRATG